MYTESEHFVAQCFVVRVCQTNWQNRSSNIFCNSSQYIYKSSEQLKRSFCEIPTRFLTPYREFEQRPHTPHWRQLDSNYRYGVRKYSRVTSTLGNYCILEPNFL
jgi:hypothetical protein